MPCSNFTGTGHFMSAAVAAAAAIAPISPLPPPISLSTFPAANSPATPPTTITGQNSCGGSTPTNGSKVQQKNPKLYKTELCRSWMETGRCNYGERCQYAHGEKEKRPVTRHPKYKTEPCQSYHKTGYCPYGPRCHFIHNENPGQLKALITANEQALRMVHELAALGIEQQQPQRPAHLQQQQHGTPKKWSMLGGDGQHTPTSTMNSMQSQILLHQQRQQHTQMYMPNKQQNSHSALTSSSPYLNAIDNSPGFLKSSMEKNFHSGIIGQQSQHANPSSNNNNNNHYHQFLGKAQSYESNNKQHDDGGGGMGGGGYFFGAAETTRSCKPKDFIGIAFGGGNANTSHGSVHSDRLEIFSKNYWSPANSPSSPMDLPQLKHKQQRPKTLDIFSNAEKNLNLPSPNFGSGGTPSSPLCNLDPYWLFSNGREEKNEDDSSPQPLPSMFSTQFACINEEDFYGCIGDSNSIMKPAATATKSPNFQKLDAIGGDFTSLTAVATAVAAAAIDELDAQLLLGNLCSSDDDYSRSSMISSNIDSGNESPMALFEEDISATAKSSATCQQSEHHQSSSQQTTPLPTDEGDILLDVASHGQHQTNRPSSMDENKITSSAKDPAVNGTAKSTDDSNLTTASSSLISLLSSSSSNTASSLAQRQQQQDKFLLAAGIIGSHSMLPPVPLSGNGGKVQQKNRLPVFERLSLNQ